MPTPIGDTGSTTEDGSQDGQIQGGGGSQSTTSVIAQEATTISTPSASATTGSQQTAGTEVTAETKSDNTPYSSGELAGGIVGAALGAALLTFLLTFLFFRRKRGLRSSYGRGKRYGPVTFVEEKASAKQDRSNAPWQAYLQQSADDRAIRGEVKALFDQIELHVENFYRKASIQPDANVAAALAHVDSGQLPGPIEELIQSSRLSRAVVKHTIAHMLVDRMTPSTSSGDSLLPAHLQMTPTKLDAATLRSQEAPAARQAYTEWKRLTSYLCPHPSDNPSFHKQRTQTSTDISNALDAAFSAWRAQGDENSFRQNERSLVTSASEVGIKLMSQSWDYKFVWSEGEEGSIVMFPGLVKTTDESGKLLHSAQMLVSPGIVRI